MTSDISVLVAAMRRSTRLEVREQVRFAGDSLVSDS